MFSWVDGGGIRINRENRGAQGLQKIPLFAQKKSTFFFYLKFSSSSTIFPAIRLVLYMENEIDIRFLLYLCNGVLRIETFCSSGNI